MKVVALGLVLGIVAALFLGNVRPQPDLDAGAFRVVNGFRDLDRP
jgi:xanthine/uracil permease